MSMSSAPQGAGARHPPRSSVAYWHLPPRAEWSVSCAAGLGRSSDAFLTSSPLSFVAVVTVLLYRVSLGISRCADTDLV